MTPADTHGLRAALTRLAATADGAAALRDWRAVSPDTSPSPPLRAIHHFACTGGTVISKALAVMPNVTLLSEIDPLSPMTLPDVGALRPLDFRPQDPLFHAAASPRPPTPETLADSFIAGLKALHGGLEREGRHLVLRGHAHAQFCLKAEPDSRPSLRSLLARDAPLRDIVTVRHPLASFTALQAHGWIGFEPPTLDLYALRYHAFLDAHAEAPVMRYESFTEDPEAFLKGACDVLGLRYTPGAPALIGTIRMTGDSGRRGPEIAPREPRPVSETLAAEARTSEAFRSLAERLGYDA